MDWKGWQIRAYVWNNWLWGSGDHEHFKTKYTSQSWPHSLVLQLLWLSFQCTKHLLQLPDLIWLHNASFFARLQTFNCTNLVLATGPGNPPAGRVWNAETGPFDSRPIQNPDPQTHGGLNLDLNPSNRGSRQVWLDLTVPISVSTYRVSHFWSRSDMLPLIVQYWHWYITVHFWCNSRRNDQNK